MNGRTLLFSLVWFGLISTNASATPTESNRDSQSKGVENLTPFLWQNRILLIRAGADAKTWQSLLQEHQAQIEERHIYWFIVDQSPVSSNFTGVLGSDFAAHLQQHYAFAEDRVLLIGKDGGIKERSEVLDFNFIYAKIDAMPMRQQEMRINRP
ncbi:MAG: DUF4174 domain-containing protein [Thiotrichales bacterium]|nr:DUF4174 domain-containing protein [Thiotrichales bacterium]